MVLPSGRRAVSGFHRWRGDSSTLGSRISHTGTKTASRRLFTTCSERVATSPTTTRRLSFLPIPGLLAQPELTLLRQGEGDPRLPLPPVSAYPTTPTLFQGVVEHMLRVALSGTYATSAQ